MLAGRILADSDVPAGSQVSVLINGLGATPPLEQYLIYRAVHRLLGERGISVARSYVGEYITSLQMAGLSVTITLLDDELLSLLNDPAQSVRFIE
jgi:dihydroxyacetone kinase